MFGQDKVARLVVEFLGTIILSSAVLSMVIYKSLPIFPATAAGFTLALLVLVIGPISGAHVNPAVTIGQWTIRRISTLAAIAYIAAQMLGGFVAWRLANFLLDSQLRNIAGPKFEWRILLAEAIGAFVLTFGIAAAIKRGYDGVASAITVGSALFIGVLTASVASNGLLNPAVALGVNSWSWAYVLGPILGAIIGMNVYVLLTEPLTRKKATKKSNKR